MNKPDYSSVSLSTATGPTGTGPIASGTITAAVLAGGMGTRLASVLPDRPKVLAPVGERIFLDLLLETLAAHGIAKAVLCLGYRADQVVDHLARHPSPLPVEVSIETAPLGTGGAIALARPQLQGDAVMVMNGDTHLPFDMALFAQAHAAGGAMATLLAVEVEDASRYGSLDIGEDGTIRAFREKAASLAEPGWISAGIYLLSPPLLDRIAALGKGSLEQDVFAALPPGSLRAHKVRGAFIDIGTPQSLAGAPQVILGKEM